MKATELMIGDWVYNSYHKKNIKWSYSEMFCPNGIPVIGRDLEPIPLTPEILEKNGWWYNVEDMWFHDEVDFCIEKFNRRFQCYEISQIKLDSVHQIQQTLRLCGLNELADNFKV